jgi:hypothetical protein
MPGTRRVIMVRAVVGIAVLVLVAVVVLRWSPSVPAGAASQPVAVAVLTGAIGPDAGEAPQGPAGQACLARIENTAGYMDLCWEAHRYPFDADPQQDYYVLRVYGTFGSGTGSGPRWAILRANMRSGPPSGAISTWPDGEFDATCEPTLVDIDPSEPGIYETLCGHITAEDPDPGTHVVTWTCEGCLLPSQRDRALSLYETVGVAEGTAPPTWEIFADLGG